VSNEGLDLLASSIAQGLHAAEVSRVGLDQVGIELMLADELAKSVANGTTAAVSVGRLRELLGFRSKLRFSSERTDLLDRADTNPVGFASGTVNSPGFRDMPRLRA